MFESFTLVAAVGRIAGLDDLPAATDAIEFRMDLAGSDPLSQFEEYDLDYPVIVTNRADWEGGEADDVGRLDRLERAIDEPSVGAVDVELASLERGDADAILDRAAETDIPVIASWHDFDGMPPAQRLRERLTRATDEADVGKVAAMAAQPTDVLPLLQVTAELSQVGRAVATMAMGAAGRHSRVIAPLYGSRIGYAPPRADAATAPGQYDLSRLAELIETVR